MPKINILGISGNSKLFSYLPITQINPQKVPTFFCELKPYAKFLNPRPTPSRRKVTQAERGKKEREKRR
jgi:hypothetical protein